MSKLAIQSYGQGSTLVLLHGWAMHSGVWQSFVPMLAEHFQVLCVDLPGFGASEGLSCYQLDNVANTILAELPVDKFNLLGWSLGATVAMAMAAISPERILSLQVLSGNPKFVQDSHWPGISPEVLAEFTTQLQENRKLCLQRFMALQVYQQPDAKQLLQTLKKLAQHQQPTSIEALMAGLAILQTSDLRNALSHLTCPKHFIFGKTDQLIPYQCAESLQQLNPDIKVSIIDQAGHVAFLSHPQAVLAHLLASL